MDILYILCSMNFDVLLIWGGEICCMLISIGIISPPHSLL